MYGQSLWFGTPRLVRQPAGFSVCPPNPQWNTTTEELELATPSKNAQQRGAMAAKLERARDAALAMQEYETERLAISAKTARLRAVRLAQQAEDRQHAKAKAPRTKAPGYRRQAA